MHNVLRDEIGRNTEQSWEFIHESIKVFKSAFADFNEAGNADFFSLLEDSSNQGLDSKHLNMFLSCDSAPLNEPFIFDCFPVFIGLL